MGESKIIFTTFGPAKKLASGENLHDFCQKRKFGGSVL
jgi:hypothetical protein